MRIGLVPLAAKPFHAGHDGLIRIASKENDEVHVYVSLSDRENVSGAAMEKIWRELIEPTLPHNVVITFVVSPVGTIYKVLGDAQAEATTQNVYTVYSDTTDIGVNFNTLNKYAGNLISSGQIFLKGIKRTETVDVSGSQMRQWLAQGDKQSFVSKLPKGLDGDKVWHVLTSMKPGPKKKKPAGSEKKPAGEQAETLLRSYVGLLIKG